MFGIKKFLTAFLLPPGGFIVILLATGVWLTFFRKNKAGWLNLALGLMLWGLSVAPVANGLMSSLENGMSIPESVTGDVIILLGGGTIHEARDLTGSGFPTNDMMERMVTAVRLQKQLQVPILITSGSVWSEQPAGAWVVRRLLIDLGVSKDDLLVEAQSWDTDENAYFSNKICQKQGFNSPILLSSPYHIKRAKMLFHHHGLSVTPYPAYLHAKESEPFTWRDMLPQYYHFANSAKALREYLGISYYWLVR